MNKPLSGLEVEYRVLELYSRDAGRREARLAFDVGQGTQDLGFRNEINVLFRCLPAVSMTLEVLDDDGRPTTGQFVFRDDRGRVYPSRTRRLAPDFFFHDQIYRVSGETVLLPPGKFQVTYTRGPEYRVATRQITVPDSETHRESFRLTRWIKLADQGWYSGDHHVHAAGCAHYEAPTEGVQPVDMLRHIRGEDLNVGCVLSWGPCWYHQKQFFEGQVNQLSTPQSLMHYDVEVSGFPSSHCGHLCLLRLKEDDYPGTTRIDQWPTWDLPILQWGRSQGGVVGFAHSGWGLQATSQEVPNYEMPRFDGIGANEFVVDTVHGAVRLHLGRRYAVPVGNEHLVPHAQLRIHHAHQRRDRFPLHLRRTGRAGSILCQARQREAAFIRRLGRRYSRRSQLLLRRPQPLVRLHRGRFRRGRARKCGRPSVLAAKSGQPLKITARAAALLDEQPHDEIRGLKLDQKPYWHIERARTGETRTVPVELIVNGRPVDKKTIVADGRVTELTFEITPERSSWVALRILAAVAHQPRIRRARRPADSGQQEERRVVSGCRRRVLGVEVAEDSRERATSCGRGLRSGAASISKDPERSHGLKRFARASQRVPNNEACVELLRNDVRRAVSALRKMHFEMQLFTKCACTIRVNL